MITRFVNKQMRVWKMLYKVRTTLWGWSEDHHRQTCKPQNVYNTKCGPNIILIFTFFFRSKKTVRRNIFLRHFSFKVQTAFGKLKFIHSTNLSQDQISNSKRSSLLWINWKRNRTHWVIGNSLNIHTCMSGEPPCHIPHAKSSAFT